MPYNKITLAELIEAWETAGSPTVCDGDHLFALFGWEYYL